MSDVEQGVAVVAFDERGTRSFALPIAGAEAVTMNRRRDSVTQDTIDTSIKGLPEGARNDGTIGLCHEVFDLIPGHSGGAALPQGKTSICGFINMANAGKKCWRGAPGVVGDGKGQFTNCNNAITHPGYEISGGFVCKSPLGTPYGAEIDAKDLGFWGLHPYTPADQFTDHDYQVHWKTYTDQTTFFEAQNTPQRMFAPNYYAKGFALHGYKLPDWASSFSIMRTKPAQKVAAQGMAFYALKTAVKNF